MLLKDIFQSKESVLFLLLWLKKTELLDKGEEYAKKIKDYTIALYKKCAEYALSKGIIIADTKFEFGLDEEGNMVIGDEMLTPDSSRFWPADGYEAHVLRRTSGLFAQWLTCQLFIALQINIDRLLCNIFR